MAGEIHTTNAGAAAGSRAGRFIESRRRSALGVPEVVALAVSALLLVAALSAYFLFLRPQRARLEALRDEQGRLTRQLEEARSTGQQSESTQASVDKILASLEDFETTRLSENTFQTQNDIINELNDLIRRHGLNLSGGGMKFEALGAGGQQRSSSAAKPVQNVFPGIGIDLSVEGAYPALRRFIRDVESDPRFVVINSVELEGIKDTGARPAAPAGDVPGAAPAPVATRGSLVALRLEMAAYFRRTPATEVSGPTQQ